MRAFLGTFFAIALGAAAAAYIYAVGPFAEQADSPANTTPTATQGGASTPPLFTNANGIDVWRRPGKHLGARVRITGPVLARRSAPEGVVVAIDVSGSAVGAYVFDRDFPASRGDLILVRGNVRGPLGGKLTLGVAPFPPLRQGSALIHADRARMLG